MLARYCHAADRRDFDAIRDLLTEDTVGDLGPAGRHEGRDSVIALSGQILASVPVTQHQVTTSVAVASDGGAHVTTCFSARHVRGDASYTIGGIYHDDLVRSPGGWLIAKRRIEVTWAEGDPAVLALPAS